MDGQTGGERKAGEGVLDVSIRPGAVRLSAGKVATVGLVRGVGKEKGREKHPPSPSFLLLLPPGRVTRGTSLRLVGAEARR